MSAKNPAMAVVSANLSRCGGGKVGMECLL
jgi:hypothetical protein